MVGVGVAPEAVLADLSDVALGTLHLAHLDHGGGELLEEPPVVVGEALDEPVGARVRGQHLVRVEHDSLVQRQRREVHVVEHLRREEVQVPQAVGVAAVADSGEALAEVVPGRCGRVAEGAAPGLADGVGPGERNQVEVVEALVAEGLEELVGGEGRRRQGEDVVLRRRGKAVLAPKVHGEGGPAGLQPILFC